MLEITVLILAIIAFAGGLGLAAALHARREEKSARRPTPRSMPATQTADVNAKAGRDPAERL